MRELHLFAGIGGGILAGKLLGHTCVGVVEIEPYCRRVLEARQREGLLEPFPIHDDIHTFDGTAWRGKADVVCGGFPCQPWSSAGKRLGADDPRHLWPEMARIVAEVRPRYVFAENVSLAAFREPWRELRRLGYRVPPALCLGACDLGAVFHRHRWWLLAADVDQQGEPAIAVDAEVAGAQDAGDPDGARLAQRQGESADACAERTAAVGAAWWQSPSRLLRLVSGHAARVESRRKRIHALGNAQVPAVAAVAFRILMEQVEQSA